MSVQIFPACYKIYEWKGERESDVFWSEVFFLIGLEELSVQGILLVLV